MNDSAKRADQAHDQSKSVEDKDFEAKHADEGSEGRVPHLPGDVLAPDPYVIDPSEDDDPILAELWRVREEQSKKYGHDMERRMADTLRMTFLFGNDVVRRSPSGKLEVIFMGLGGIRTDFDDTTLAEFSRGNKPAPA